MVTRWALRDTAITLRQATVDDLPAIIDLLAANQLGAARDGIAGADDLAAYHRAFWAIDSDPAHLLVVAEMGGGATGRVVGTLQLSFLPGQARRGALRAQVEAVRVAADHRDQGIGSAMIEWAIQESRRRGAALVQLTSDRSRTQAHRFYERWGFVRSHDGFKLRL
jgi:GNAT superfamily N-acetyltransferase